MASRVVIERGGVKATRSAIGEYTVELLRFPPRHRIPPFEFDRGYIAIVLDGGLTKTFAREAPTLSRDSVATLPAGAVHATAFGPSVTRVITIRGREPALTNLVRRLRYTRGTAVSGLGRRLAVELQVQDLSWGLAAEGVVLQLLATTGRDAANATQTPWLRSVRDILHERVPDAPGSLSELAATVGVHPAHLARCFRREYGRSVGEYARALRLEWAAEQLALNDASLPRSRFVPGSPIRATSRGHSGDMPGSRPAVIAG